MKLLSLFSGIGAFEKALKNLDVDFELVNFCEKDKHAVESYTHIHGFDSNLNLGDITKVPTTNVPNFDLMTYGFPCQSFSVAGKRLGFSDKENGNLFFESVRFIDYHKPKCAIAENVKGLYNHDGGRTLQTIIETLNNVGYNTYYKVLNSVDFDVPQNRERIFLVSIRKDVDKHIFEFPKGQTTKKTVRDIIEPTNTRHINPSLKPYLNPDFHKEYKNNKGIIKVFDGNSQGYFTSDFGGKRIYSIDGICPTLTTKRNNTCFVELGGTLTGKECFRLQGFSDVDYDKVKNLVSETQIIKQAGNSITVSVIQAILSQLLDLEIL